MKPKILSFDIESAGVNALKSDLGFVIVFGYKWLHRKQAISLSLSRKELGHFDDERLLKEASAIFEEADIVVGHFASVFDRRFIQGRLLINGLPPIPPTKMRDTCMLARSAANFSSNRLKHLCKILGLKNQKLDNNWPMAWFRVMQGDEKALAALAKYCRGDVLAVEELYLALRPFDNVHPRIMFDYERTVCLVCGSGVQYRGYALVGKFRYARYQCTGAGCGKWGRDAKRTE